MIGAAERNLKIIRETLGVHITTRDGMVRLSGSSRIVGQATRVLEELAHAARQHQPLNRHQLLDLITRVGQTSTPGTPAAELSSTAGGDTAGGVRPHSGGSIEIDNLEVYTRARRIRAATEGQRDYLKAIATHDLTLCIGPAGTGKTYLAVAAATAMLKRGLVRKLVLVRPAVEAGERLGFLPGDMQQKVNPFLRPLLDALHDMMDFEQIQRFMAVDLIEIIPLAFMRGRTLNDCMVILDEAQNTTRPQMLMFLTRLGHGSKMIVTGDTTQIDLEDPGQSGMVDAVRRLRGVKGVAFVKLAQADIVRHSLVQRIVEAYAPTRHQHRRLHVGGQDGPSAQGPERPHGHLPAHPSQPANSPGNGPQETDSGSPMTPAPADKNS